MSKQIICHCHRRKILYDVLLEIPLAYKYNYVCCTFQIKNESLNEFLIFS